MRFLFALILSIPSFSPASGVLNGGGGKAVVCRDQVKNILSVELLDLYEARQIYGLKIAPNQTSIEQQVNDIIQKIHHSNLYAAFQIDPLVKRVRQNVKFISSDVQLIPVDDALEIVLPNECKVEQLANYVDDSLLLVDESLWQKMNSQNQASLIMHEAIYRFQRGEGARDSRRSRKLVAYLFSDFKFERVANGISGDADTCKGIYDSGEVGAEFYIYPDENLSTHFQFTKLNGLSIFSKKTGVAPIGYPWVNVRASSSDDLNMHLESNFEGNDTITIVHNSILKNDQIHFYFAGAKRMHILCSKDPRRVSRFGFSITPTSYLLPGAARSCVNVLKESREMDIHAWRINIPQLAAVWNGPGDLELTKIIIDIDDPSLENSHYTHVLEQEEVNAIMFGKFSKDIIQPVSIFGNSGCSIQFGGLSFTYPFKLPAQLKVNISLLGHQILGAKRELVTTSNEAIVYVQPIEILEGSKQGQK